MQLELRTAVTHCDEEQVHIGVYLCTEEALALRGLSARLSAADGRPISPKTVLMTDAALTAGSHKLCGSITCEGPVPEGARVVVKAWNDGHVQRVASPATPAPALRRHVCEATQHCTPEQVELRAMSAGEAERLTARFPWLAEPLRADPVQEDALTIEMKLDQGECPFKDEFDLDDDTADWLQNLLDEEEDLAF